MRNDEKVALVEKAKAIVENMVSYHSDWEAVVTFGKLNYPQMEYHSWLALQSFFKRHEEVDGGGFSNFCEPCGEIYPCPEAVTTAEIIVNGVKE